MPNKKVIKKRKIDIRHSERALLTDTLPFELPIFFSNENLAVLSFTTRNKAGTHSLHEKLLLNNDLSTKQPTKPYSFEINRNASKKRRLYLAHPKSQHLISLFYGKYEQFITNACARSRYSLRFPSRVATHYVDPKYAIDAQQADLLKPADEDPAGFRDQSRWASTYFSYKDFNLSHKFFDSEEFTNLERKYPFMMNLDVSRCFESIYTHSIEWSMRGKEFSKDHLPFPQKNKVTFESTFDAVIRHANQNETHGIIIGPESSRIFAEIILQSIDRNIATLVAESEHSNVFIRRYVDDYYIFGNSSHELESVKEIVQSCLLQVNLHLNDNKSHISGRPFSSKTSAARSHATNAIDSFFSASISLLGSEDTARATHRLENLRSKLFKEIRRIATELDVPYENFSSIALSVINNRLSDYRSKAQEPNPQEDIASRLSHQSWLLACIRIGQFLFSIDNRVSTSVKLTSIYNHALEIASTLSCAKDPIESQIIDGLRNDTLGLASRTADEVTRINHICMVDLLLTGHLKVTQDDLREHIGDYENLEDIRRLSMFQLLAILFISRRRHRFQLARSMVISEIKRRISAANMKLTSDTESTILFTELVACPHIDDDDKLEVVRDACRIVLGKECTESEARALIKSSSWISFVDWNGIFDVAKMLARRELTPAYE